MKKEPLLYEPETIMDARRRYPEALQHLYNVHRIRYMNKPGPQFERSNVFDFENGLRLIISLEFAPLNKVGERGPFEHVSASWMSQPKEGTVLLDEVIRIYSYVSKRDPKKRPIWTYLDPETNVFHMMFKRNRDLRIEDFDEDGNLVPEDDENNTPAGGGGRDLFHGPSGETWLGEASSKNNSKGSSPESEEEASS